MLFGSMIFHSGGLRMWQTVLFFGLGFDWQIMAPPLLFFLALHAARNRHPSHRFVASGNNYTGPPEVRQRGVCEGWKGGGGRSGRVRRLMLHNRKRKTTNTVVSLSWTLFPWWSIISSLHPYIGRNLCGRHSVRKEGRLLMLADHLRPGI